MMNAVGIDVSKGRSMVAVARPGEVVASPFIVSHTQSGIHELIDQLRLAGWRNPDCHGTYGPILRTRWLRGFLDAGFFVSCRQSQTHQGLWS